jgi:hypothetical protein
MVADQDPGCPQQLIQAPLTAVRLGSAHFDDVQVIVLSDVRSYESNARGP